MSVAFQRAAAKEAVREALARTVRDRVPPSYVAIAGRDGELFVEGKPERIYARLGGVSGEVIEARADLVVPEIGDIIMIEGDRAVPGSLRVSGVLATSREGGLSPWLRKFHREHGHRHRLVGGGDYDGPPLDVVYSVAAAGSSLTGDLILEAEGLDIQTQDQKIRLSTIRGRHIQENGFTMPYRIRLNFVGDGVSLHDDPQNNATRVEILGGGGGGGGGGEIPQAVRSAALIQAAKSFR